MSDDSYHRDGILFPATRRSVSRLNTQALICSALVVLVALSVLSVHVIRGTSHGPAAYNSYDATTKKPRLWFSEERSFKIMQLTDMHFGEAEDTLWGPFQDVETYQLLDTLIRYEQPDILILSGDQLTANDVDANATAYYEEMDEFLETYGIPWALIFGNHDDMPLEIGLPNGTIVKTTTKTSRRQLAQADQAHSLSLTQIGPSDLFGTSNYVLPIYESSGRGDILLQIILLDSGGGSIPKQLDSAQVEWVQQQLNASSSIPTAVFQHIPTTAFGFDQERCVGMNGDGGFEAVDTESGIMDCLKSHENVMFLAVGHNHGNDYCCSLDDSALHVCFGKHSGYGGYGTFPRGARVYQVDLLDDDKNPFAWKTWVRMESGEVVDEYASHGDRL